MNTEHNHPSVHYHPNQIADEVNYRSTESQPKEGTIKKNHVHETN